jgi:hypothetical protein
MNEASLILIDGLTGVGKSTTAQHLWLSLEQRGTAAHWVYEHDTSHPVWPPGEAQRIVQRGSLPAGFMDTTLPGRWAQLADACIRGHRCTILESALLQATIGLLLAMNVPERDIVTCLRACEQACAPARPMLFWLGHGDVAESLRATFDDRRSDDYENALVALLAATPYGRTHPITGFAGLVQFYETWSRVAQSACETFSMPVVPVTASGWLAREQQIADALGWPPLEPPRVRIEAPTRFIGRYRDTCSQDGLAIAGSEHGLYLDDARRTPLIPRGGASFHVTGMCIEMAFADERDGRFHRLSLHGNLPGLSPAWERIDPLEGAHA